MISDLVYFTTRVPDTSDTSATRTARVQHERHECDTSATRARRVRHECYRATRVKILDFDNSKSENIFSHPYISYMANKRLQVEESNFILRTTIWKCLVPMPKCV